MRCGPTPPRWPDSPTGSTGGRVAYPDAPRPARGCGDPRSSYPQNGPKTRYSARWRSMTAAQLRQVLGDLDQNEDSAALRQARTTLDQFFDPGSKPQASSIARLIFTGGSPWSAMSKAMRRTSGG